MSWAARRVIRAAARAGWISNLGHVPRRWPSRALRWLLMAPFLVLITEFHRARRCTYDVAQCSCGRIIHFEDLRWLRWPAWATGCLVAQVHNWINWRRVEAEDTKP